MRVTTLDFNDRTDFDDADRGFVGALEPGIVKAADGRVVWDSTAYAFLDGDCPDTADPSLWRQSQLCVKQGLYEVTDGVYQIRGLDLSNMTLIEGDRGVIVVDPLISTETAAAGLTLYRRHRGDRPVTAVIYTHSHVDHFGGVLGVISAEDDVPILAPAGFMEHAVAENVYAGGAMGRRAQFYGGDPLESSATGRIGLGLGVATSTGAVSLLPPTADITRTGQEETVDGVRFHFQLTPGTEAPAEMNFLLPDRRALCMAENATHNLHNVLTLRGALVRDTRMWARYLNESIVLYADQADVVFASHHWPTWGGERIVTFLSQQRDLYAYLHDQTLRLLNQGYVGSEIAELIQLPPALEAAWHARGYYGSVSHNVKAIYQRYMGWFDGNPAHLWEHPPEETAKRYVDCMGGVDAVVTKARGYLDAGDPRFAVQLLNHAVFADPDHQGAKDLLARTYQRLGQGAECGTWRNYYLTGAKELRSGVRPVPWDFGAGMAPALTVEQVFDSVAIRIDGPRAWSERFTIDWDFTDLKEHYRMTLSNGVLIHHPDPHPNGADLSVMLTKPQLLELLAGRRDGLDGIQHTGDPGVLARLTGLLDKPDPSFAIVTP